MDEVFAATGLDRMLLMALFIQTASGADLAAVIDRAEDGKIQETAISDQAWLRWVELDLEAALKHHRPANAWWAYAKLDPQAALARCLESAKVMLPLVLRSIGQSNPNLARKLLAEHPEIDPELVLNGIFEGLGKADPAAATALALEKGGSYLDGQFNNWMERDQQRALAWMRGLTNPAARRRVEDLAMTRLIANDPAAGLQVARQLPPGRSQTTHTVEAITALSRQDPAAARAEAEALPTPHTRQQALAALAVASAATDPAMAGALVSAIDWKEFAKVRPSDWSYHAADGIVLNAGSDGAPPLESTLTQLMAAAPQATAEALAALPDQPDQGAGPLYRAVEKWAALQPEAASAWLKEQPAGPAKDQGIQGLTNWLTTESPEPDFAAAAAWAGAASAEFQFGIYDRILRQWKSRDAGAAVAALETLPVTDAQRDQLRRSLTSLAIDPFDP